MRVLGHAGLDPINEPRERDNKKVGRRRGLDDNAREASLLFQREETSAFVGVVVLLYSEHQEKKP